MVVSKRVKVNEVGIRDGLQFEPRRLSALQKARFCDRLACDARLPYVEVGTFGDPQQVQAMADTPEVIANLRTPWREGTQYVALAPNRHYLRQAMAAGIRHSAVFVGATDAFNQANVRKDTAAALAAAKKVVELGAASDPIVTVRGYVSICWAPGVTHKDVIRVASALAAFGCQEIALGDTTASATPETVQSLIEALWNADVGVDKLAVHFHTRDQEEARAWDCVRAALEYQVRSFDGSVAGLGGCLASGSLNGNIATERLVRLLHDKGYETGVAQAALDAIAAAILRDLASTSLV